MSVWKLSNWVCAKQGSSVVLSEALLAELGSRFMSGDETEQKEAPLACGTHICLVDVYNGGQEYASCVIQHHFTVLHSMVILCDRIPHTTEYPACLTCFGYVFGGETARNKHHR